MPALDNGGVIFSDHELARRLERAEAQACAQYAVAKAEMFPQSGAAWIECAGAYAVFDGADSPVTQSFGLGMFAELDDATLDTMDRFFVERGAPVQHEVSPFAGVGALDLLCRRGYRPMEMTNVLYREVAAPKGVPADGIGVRIAGRKEAERWNDVSARGWAAGSPEILEMVRSFGAIMGAREGSVCFLAEIDAVPGAAGALAIHEGVALFAGASTVPEMRRRGLQGALLRERMRYAAEHGCEIAMMGALPGSESQRNAERAGFRVAYTRTKWKLSV